MIFMLSTGDIAINVLQIVSATRNADGTWVVQLPDNKQFTLSTQQWEMAVELLRETRTFPRQFVFNGNASAV